MQPCPETLPRPDKNFGDLSKRVLGVTGVEGVHVDSPNLGNPYFHTCKTSQMKHPV